MRGFDINDLSDLGLNLLLYGEPGCGKTRFVASVGELMYTLAVDVDNGFKTFRLVPPKWVENIQPVKLDGFKDIDKLYKLASANDPDKWSKELGVEIKKPFEALAIDTWSELNWEVKEEKRRLLGKDGKGSITWRDNIQIQDWGSIIDLNTLAIKHFCDLPINFVCTMHEIIKQDEVTKIVKGTPSINGKFAEEVGKYFDVLGHMAVSPQGKYVIETRATARYQAKSRLALDAKIEDPTLRKLMEAAGLHKS